jgi:site-specific recombinase XerD
LESFASLLARQAYCQNNGQRKIRLVAHLSRWLSEQRIPLVQLGEQQVTAFLETRWKTQNRASGDSRTLMLLLEHLRQTGVISVPRTPKIRCSLDRLVGDYEQFLRQERCLAPGSIGMYLPVIRRFLKHRFPTGRLHLHHLRAGDAADFILNANTDYGRRYLQSVVSILRSFLGFLLQRGRITTPLANAVPAVAARSFSELPKFLEAAQVEKLLKSCDRRRSIGRRDYAVLLLLARLGMRAGEVANLCFEHIDWRAGEVCIRGKGARLDRLPLPRDVGQAIADYLKTRRSGSSRHVFLCGKAPYEGLGNHQVVTAIVQRALKRAQLHPPHRGAHLLRHSLATGMLRGGATMAQIAQVLRHQRTETTEIYAKVDLNALRALAPPWPGGAR